MADKWETVAEARGKLQFDADGDEFIGMYEGVEMVTDPNTKEEYKYYQLRGDDDTPYLLSAAYQLERGLEPLPAPVRVRLVRTSVTQTKRGEMINFLIQTAK